MVAIGDQGLPAAQDPAKAFHGVGIFQSPQSALGSLGFFERNQGPLPGRIPEDLRDPAGGVGIGDQDRFEIGPASTQDTVSIATGASEGRLVGNDIPARIGSKPENGVEPHACFPSHSGNLETLFRWEDGRNRFAPQNSRPAPAVKTIRRIAIAPSTACRKGQMDDVVSISPAQFLAEFFIDHVVGRADEAIDPSSEGLIVPPRLEGEQFHRFIHSRLFPRERPIFPRLGSPAVPGLDVEKTVRSPRSIPATPRDKLEDLGGS